MHGRPLAALATAFLFAVVLRSDGTLWAAGDNTLGQLALGDTTDRLVPTPTTFKVDVTAPRAIARQNVTIKWGKRASLGYSLADEYCPKCIVVKMRITKGTRVVKTFNLGTRACGTQYVKAFTCRLARGTYTWRVFATDTAGNTQSTQNTKKLIVK